MRVPSEATKSGYRYIEVIACPKFGENTSIRNCKVCEHCRIAFDNHVKCSFEADKYKEDHPMIHPINL